VWIRSLSIYCGYDPGAVVEVPDGYARNRIARGYAESVEAPSAPLEPNNKGKSSESRNRRVRFFDKGQGPVS
jgi:hypothetical protein